MSEQGSLLGVPAIVGPDTTGGLLDGWTVLYTDWDGGGSPEMAGRRNNVIGLGFFVGLGLCVWAWKVVLGCLDYLVDLDWVSWIWVCRYGLWYWASTRSGWQALGHFLECFGIG